MKKIKFVIALILTLAIIFWLGSLGGCKADETIEAPVVDIEEVEEPEEVEEELVTIPMELERGVKGYIFLATFLNYDYQIVYQGKKEVSVIYTIQRGDTLLDIAGKFGANWNELLDNNKYVANPDKIWAGEILFIKDVARVPYPEARIIYTIDKDFVVNDRIYPDWRTLETKDYLATNRYYKKFWFDRGWNLCSGEEEGVLFGEGELEFLLRNPEGQIRGIPYEEISPSKDSFFIRMD